MFSRRRIVSLSRPESFNSPQVHASGRRRSPIYGADMPLEWYGRGERPAEDEIDLSDDPNRPLTTARQAATSSAAATNLPARRWEHPGAGAPLETYVPTRRHPAWYRGSTRALLSVGRFVFGGILLYTAISHFRRETTRT